MAHTVRRRNRTVETDARAVLRTFKSPMRPQEPWKVPVAFRTEFGRGLSAQLPRPGSPLRGHSASNRQFEASHLLTGASVVKHGI